MANYVPGMGMVVDGVGNVVDGVSNVSKTVVGGVSKGMSKAVAIVPGAAPVVGTRCRDRGGP